MKLYELPKIVRREKKRVGRGYGSGKGGHTVGRGQKGQKVRGKIHPLFEGTKTKKSLLQRLPLLRGRGRLKPMSPKPVIINIGQLNSLPAGVLVDIPLLIKAGIVGKEAEKRGVKLLGTGILTKKLTVAVPAGRQAARKIESAGGSIKQ